MNNYVLKIRLIGDLDDLEAVAQVADSFPERISYRLLRQGEVRGRIVQPVNVFLIPLANWERRPIFPYDDRNAVLAEERAQLANAAAVIAQMTPTLTALDRSRTSAELSLSIVLIEDGGFDLPAKLVTAAAAADLSLRISITPAVWPSDDEKDDS